MTCSYAACLSVADHVDPAHPQWRFCLQHYAEHRADLYGEPWPRLRHFDVGLHAAFLQPCGTRAAAKRHHRNGETCVVCNDACRRMRRGDGYISGRERLAS